MTGGGAREDPPILEEYSRLAPHYDRRWSSYIEATTEATIQRMRLPPAGSVLDVGCGTGALLGALGKRYPAITLVGVDAVPGMLEVARRQVPPGTELREAWAESLPFEDGVFDSVVSANALHYFRQPSVALAEMTRVLRVGGELVVTDWCADYLACRICDWWLRRFSPAHVKAYRQREFLRLLERAGHPGARIERYRVGWFWGMMTATARRAS